MNWCWTAHRANKPLLPPTIVCYLLCAGMLAWHAPAYAQQAASPLDRVVTVSFNNTHLPEVLARLAAAGYFTFSYNPDIISRERLVTADFRDQTVNEVLNQLFRDHLQFKARNNYIILTRTGDDSGHGSSLILTGHIRDRITGRGLPAVSIYEKHTLSAAISDPEGYFTLRLDHPSASTYISVAKKDFKDTVVMITRQADQLFISLEPSAHIPVDRLANARPLPDTLGEIRHMPGRSVIHPVETKPRKPQQINMQNIRDTLHRRYQISFLPFAGTNHMLSGNVVNKYSFNMLGGYALGAEKAEFGGVFNIDRGNVEAAQFAGVFNATGGAVKGSQFAGVLNTNLGHVDGVQFAGVLNANGGESSGIQLAGVLNAQLKSYEGAQLAGVMNANIGASSGTQLAGVVNAQIYDYKGFQFAGVANFATHKLSGAQVAGVLNVGMKVKGLQLGLVNIADSLEGVSIGLLSLVRHGYHQVEFSADDIFHLNMSFRTGVRSFYNILSVGIFPDTFSDPLWYAGYGFGTAPHIWRKWYVNIDATANHVLQGHRQEVESENVLGRLYLGIEFQAFKKVAFTVGAMLNSYVTSVNGETNPPDIFMNHTPRNLRDRTSDDGQYRAQTWWSGKIGVRFF